MGLLEKVQAQRARNAWRVGPGVVERWEGSHGHDDDRFSPESYGDYIATSNEVYSAIDLRARLLASRQVKLYKGESPNLQEQTQGRLRDLLRHVNPFWTANRLWRATEQCMGLWGEAYWILEGGDRFRPPREIFWAKPSRMTPVPHSNDYLAGFIYKPANGGQDILFAPDEVLWFRYPNPIDEFSALAPMAAARLAADVASAGMSANRNLFANGLQLGGIVAPATDKVKFSEEQATELEKLIERRFKGVDKAHRWAVLRFEAQFKGMDVSPQDAQFVEAMNLSARQVWRALGVPSPLLNDLEHATLANAQVYQTILWEHTLVPEGDFLTTEVEEQLLLRHFKSEADHILFDFADVPALQQAHTATWDRERGQIEAGAITINEWRKARGMPPVAWGDEPWMPVNKAKVNPDGTIDFPVAPSTNGNGKTAAHV